MAVLGIITCETLAPELAHLLANDPEIHGISVVDDLVSRRLLTALESRGVSGVRRIPHLSSHSPEPSARLEVLVRVLDQSLHGRRATLRRAVAAAAQQMRTHAGALLLGYGRCGNTFRDPRSSLDVAVPLFFPMEGDRPVDDCVGLLLGGSERYQAEQRSLPGTFFMTPGWSCLWRKMLAPEAFGSDPELVRRIFRGYRRILLIVTPVMHEEEMRRNTADLAASLDLRVESCSGTLTALERALRAAKESLVGRG